MRPGLCDAALRLGRMLEVIGPCEPEVHGLAALMEIQASRLGRARRTGPASRSGSWTRTAARWDKVLIRRGLVALDRAERLGGALGPYGLQAAIAACHARAATAGGHRLGPHRRAVRRARAAHAVTHRRAQSRRRRRDGLRARRPGWPPSNRSPASPALRATTFCRRSAATSSPGPGARGGGHRVPCRGELTSNERERALLLDRAAAAAAAAAPSPLD